MRTGQRGAHAVGTAVGGSTLIRTASVTILRGKNGPDFATNFI
jgi:hypothetical protein